MAFSFLLEDGLEYTGGTTSNTSVTIDKGLTRNITPAVRTAQFGDGYQQRVADGIHPIAEKLNVKFSNRPKVEIDAIASTFTTRAGVTSFDFIVGNEQASGNQETIKVVCQSWNISYNFDQSYSLTAGFLRVYE